MADAKLTALTENTSPVKDDLLYMVDDPAGTPLDRKVEFENLPKATGMGATISVEGNSTATTISSSSTDWSNAVQITVFDTDGAENNATADHTNDHITVDVAGTYLILINLSFSGGLSDTYSFSAFKNNGATRLGPLATRKLGTGGDVGSAGLTALATLSATDTVEVWIQNEDATSDCTIQDGSLTIIRVW
jgi:hypothetical protein